MIETTDEPRRHPVTRKTAINPIDELPPIEELIPVLDAKLRHITLDRSESSSITTTRNNKCKNSKTKQNTQ